MPNVRQPGIPCDVAERRLSEIAELLGCSPEIFMHGAKGPDEMAEAAELLCLCLAIESRENRQRLLSFARELAHS